MENTAPARADRLTPVTGGLAFGAAASLFNNLAISIAIFLLDLFFARFGEALQLTPGTLSYTIITSVIPLAFIVIVGVAGIWLGVRAAARLMQKMHTVPEVRLLPLFSGLFFSAPIALWFVMQLSGDLLAVLKGFQASPDWISLAYLAGQLLIFGGAVFLFTLLYVRRRHNTFTVETSDRIRTELTYRTAGFAALLVLGMTAFIAFLHAIEMVLSGRGPLFPAASEGFLSNTVAIRALLFVLSVALFAGAFYLRKQPTVGRLLKDAQKFSSYEPLVAAAAAAGGMLTAIGYSLNLGFVFTPYATLFSTTAVLLGITLSAIVYGKGRRDHVYVYSRVAAYVVGFFGQPAVLGGMLSLFQLAFQ